MDRHPSLLLKDTGQMKGRRVNGTGDLVESDAFTQPAPEVGFDRLGAVCVIGISAVSTALARQAVSGEGSFKHIGDNLKDRRIDPERFEPF